ncbi:MAG: multicopper oxidase domain-containing protein [Acidimicrobiia bacterium]
MSRFRLRKQDRQVFGLGAWIFSFFAIVFAFGALAVAANALTTSKDAKSVAAVGGAGSKVTLSEFKIDPAMVTVPKGGSLAVTNGGTVEHNLAVQGTDLKTAMLKPGESAVLDVGSLKAGDYTIICQVSGHEAAGMKAMLMIGSGGASSAGSTSDAALRAADKTNNVMMKQQIDGYVAQLKTGMNTKGAGNQPLPPKVLPDGTKEFDLTAKVVDWEVEPGKTVKAWTYNGTVPGPMIKVATGDKVRIVLTNDLPQSTSLHMHGIEAPNSMDGVPFITQDPIEPGKSFTYDFVAKGPAVGMYHSHDYAVSQVSNGMAGALIIGDEPLPAGYGPVTQELPMMLNDAGAIGFSLNGKSFPATAPIVANAGDTVEIHYMNEGQQIHPMHLHGIPQLVIAKDGNPLPQPYLADTVMVAPGERYTVLVKPTADEKGVWAFHCHILSHAEHENGMMFGMVTAFIVQ